MITTLVGIGEKIKLPEPKYNSNTSVEQALLKRRSVRVYKNEPLALADVSQLLWATQGITDPKNGFRTAPSAGAWTRRSKYLFAGSFFGFRYGGYRKSPPK